MAYHQSEGGVVNVIQRCLDLDEDIGALIFPALTGVEYTNQVGGYSCTEMSLEGYVLPTRVPFTDLQAMFWPPDPIYDKDLPEPENPPPNRYQGGCTPDGILDEADANWLDALFAHKVSTLGDRPILRIDRSRLKEAMEAWLPILYWNEWEPWGPEDGEWIPGVLTWENSD